MFDAHWWALLPEERIVERYSECLDSKFFIASREKFPLIEVATHVDLLLSL